MTVYIEYVLIDNLTFNTLLLFATFLTLRLKPRWWRILLSALFGTLCALALPFARLSSAVSFAVKFLIALVMTLIVLPKFKLKYYIMSNLIFLAYTFVLGGAILGLFYLSGTDFTAMTTLNYVANVPVGLYVGGMALFCYLVFNVVRYIGEAKKKAVFVRSVRLVFDGKVFELSGYVDSGNMLTEDGLPVCFVFDKRVKRLVGAKIAEGVTDFGRRGTENRFKTIFYDTVAGTRQKAYAFRPDTFEVDNRRVEVFAALAGKGLSRAKPQFDVLLGADLAE